ncbi:Hypothetical protein PHPALM_20043 [Phytophthora palmivora]|uniref:Uncharacterized protein n=1 Tax=Phytophthora palmivora TaxID=4796 RepID=A0A2P4XFV4_9STRA|nr:Hypothetical protein PHPALM_20043 [Phytophthora palmivora]
MNTTFARKGGEMLTRAKPKLRQDQKCAKQGHPSCITGIFFDTWVGDLAGQDTIFGMDFMVPAGICQDLACGSISLPDELRIQLSGHRKLYSDNARLVTLGEHVQITTRQSIELRLPLGMLNHENVWVTRGDHWVPTVVKGLGKRRYQPITNVISEKTITPTRRLAGDHIPHMPGFVSVGSRRYMGGKPGGSVLPPAVSFVASKW